MILCFFFGYSEFRSVTKEICKLPSFFSSTLFRKIDTNCTGIVTRFALIYSPENRLKKKKKTREIFNCKSRKTPFRTCSHVGLFGNYVYFSLSFGEIQFDFFFLISNDILAYIYFPL